MTDRKSFFRLILTEDVVSDLVIRRELLETIFLLLLERECVTSRRSLWRHSRAQRYRRLGLIVDVIKKCEDFHLIL
jgi:hypothetical protein